MHLEKLLQRALAVLSLILTVEALTFSLELQPRHDKLDTAPSKKWSSGVLKRSDTDPSGYDIDLEDWFNRTDCQWSTTISIGTPGQEITVAVGTGSMPLLVPSTSCSTCFTLYRFGSSNSTTFKPGDGNSTRYEFVTGPDTMPLSKPMGANCRLNNDTVSLGGLQLDTQSFLLCDEYDSLFNVMPIAGVLSLDTYDPSVPAKTLLWNLWENGQLDNPIFSLYMPAGVLKSGQLTLGGQDSTKYTGDLRYVRLHMDTNGNTGGIWIAPQSAVYANGRRLGNASDGAAPLPAGYAVFDTGTAFIQTPDHATAAALYAQLSPQFELIDPAGAWGAPCAAMQTLAPALTFALGGDADAHNFTIPAQNFNLGEYPTKKGYCQGIFNSPLAPMLGPDKKPVWVLGSPFLKAFYSVWNGLDKQIGFADLVATDLGISSAPP